MLAHFATTYASLVADIAVACLAVLCLLTSKLSWRGVVTKRPVAAVGLVNVALLMSGSASMTGRFAASVAAAVALSMCTAANASYSNLQALLHFVRALSIAFDPPQLRLAVAAGSALIHLFVAWQLLSSETKAIAMRCLYDMFEIRGIALVMQGKRRPLTVEDIRDPVLEDEFCLECKTTCDNTAQRQVQCDILLLCDMCIYVAT
ncbi:hypothetical protein GGH95_002775 [Coemansia sp. RSA 1836]|nr:hypothetical protein GGH95_002775 [Coemansia sp. RSA 1836]